MPRADAPLPLLGFLVNAPVTAAPSGAASRPEPRTPEQHIDDLADAMAQIAKRLLAKCEQLEVDNIALRRTVAVREGQLADALDEIARLTRQLDFGRASARTT